jgi:hypothetical protein
MSKPSRVELEDYVNMVMAMNPSMFVNTAHRPLLLDFLWVASTANDYEVCLDDIISMLAVHGLHKQKSHLMRELLFLEEGNDFIESKGERRGEQPGRNPKHHWLTVAAFKRICLRAYTPIRKFLLEYFMLVEQIFRQNSLQGIQYRRAMESTSQRLETEKKLLRLQHVRFPSGPCVYIIGVFDEKGHIKHLKEGWCLDMNHRYATLISEYYGFAIKVLFHMLTPNNPFAVEQCGFNGTPDKLRSPYDREIVDTTLEDAIDSLIKCDKFLQSQRQDRQKRYEENHKTIRDEERRLFEMPTILLDST